MQTATLHELNAHIRQVLALNFSTPVWVSAEIAACKESRGHYYLELVQKGETEILAQAGAVLWQRQYATLRRALGRSLDEVLQDGLEVRMLVQVDFHERFGLKLTVADVDPAYTFGLLEVQRRQTLEQLQREDLLNRNRQLGLPRVVQRIAVVSSDSAAGWEDFKAHLQNNPFGYRYSCRLFTAAMQGQNTSLEFPAAMESIRRHAAEFDAVAVIRGGGARLDLTAFDHIDVARSAARMPLPVLVGIGHETDVTVLDAVAFASLKTPTAVADFLIQHNLYFENSLLRLAERLRMSGAQALQSAQIGLQTADRQVGWMAGALLQRQRERLADGQGQLPGLIKQNLRNAGQALDHAALVCEQLDPERVLRRGYVLAYRRGEWLNSAARLRPGDPLEVRFADGRIHSVVGKEANGE